MDIARIIACSFRCILPLDWDWKAKFLKTYTADIAGKRPVRLPILQRFQFDIGLYDGCSCSGGISNSVPHLRKAAFEPTTPFLARAHAKLSVKYSWATKDLCFVPQKVKTYKTDHRLCGADKYCKDKAVDLGAGVRGYSVCAETVLLRHHVCRLHAPAGTYVLAS